MTEIQAEAQANTEQFSQAAEADDVLVTGYPGQQSEVHDPLLEDPSLSILRDVADESSRSTLEQEYGGSATDWEQEAKKFQSLYDKSQSEVKDVEQLKALGQFLETRPDLIQMLQDNIVGKNTNAVNEEPMLSEEEFNPWDAYYKPESPSFKLRQKMEKSNINQALGEYTNNVQEQVFMNNTVSELKNVYRLEQNEVQDFIKWSTQPTDSLGLDTLVKVWKEVNGKDARPQSSLEAVRQSKAVPRSAGSVPSANVARKSDADKIWESIANSGALGRIP
jgi:hypothetical protein